MKLLSIDNIENLWRRCVGSNGVCLTQFNKDELFYTYIIFMILWYFFRKIQYQTYARRRYPGLDRRQLTFYGRWIFEYRQIKLEELRKRYFRYLIEIDLLFFGIFVFAFFLDKI
jgi:hypothetical protein